jgi:type I restriction enzyme M protein
VLFFEKGRATEKVWYYSLNLPRNLGKKNSLNERDLEEFVALSPTQADSDNSWCVKVAGLDKTTWDLTPVNPNRKKKTEKRTPDEILAEIEETDLEAALAIAAIKELL